MNPPRLAILQFDADNTPGYVAPFLERSGQPFELLRLDLDPHRPIAGYDGYVLMGGPMMVGDDLPWMGRVLDQLRHCLAEGRPVLGHCLGAQLLAHAAGGTVGPCPHPEVGWVDVAPCDNARARTVLGHLVRDGALPVYHWHLQSFSLPPGAELLLTRSEMPTQAFTLGPHFAFQSHIEVDTDILRRWYELQPDPVGAYPSGSIQTPAQALADAPIRLPRMRALAERVYEAWLGEVRTSRETRVKP